MRAGVPLGQQVGGAEQRATRAGRLLQMRGVRRSAHIPHGRQVGANACGRWVEPFRFLKLDFRLINAYLSATHPKVLKAKTQGSNFSLFVWQTCPRILHALKRKKWCTVWTSPSWQTAHRRSLSRPPTLLGSSMDCRYGFFTQLRVISIEIFSLASPLKLVACLFKRHWLICKVEASEIMCIFERI